MRCCSILCVASYVFSAAFTTLYVPLFLFFYAATSTLNDDAPQRLPSWADKYPAQVGSLVDKSMPLHEYMDKRDIRRQGRFTVLAMAAAKMAVAEGGLDITKLDSDKFGVIIGSGIGGVEVFRIHPSCYIDAGSTTLADCLMNVVVV